MQHQAQRNYSIMPNLKNQFFFSVLAQWLMFIYIYIIFKEKD
jgi:hypothetical protein